MSTRDSCNERAKDSTYVRRSVKRLLGKVAKPGNKPLDLVQRGLVGVCVALLAGMATLMFVVVVTGKIVGQAIPHSELYLIGMLAWGTFLILGSVSRRDEHIRIGFFIETVLRDRAKPFWTVVENITGLAYCVFAAWVSWSWVSKRIAEGAVEFLGLETYPAWIPILCVPIGFSLCALFYLERGVKQLWPLVSGPKHKQPSGNAINGQGKFVD